MHIDRQTQGGKERGREGEERGRWGERGGEKALNRLSS